MGTTSNVPPSENVVSAEADDCEARLEPVSPRRQLLDAPTPSATTSGFYGWPATAGLDASSRASAVTADGAVVAHHMLVLL